MSLKSNKKAIFSNNLKSNNLDLFIYPYLRTIKHEFLYWKFSTILSSKKYDSYVYPQGTQTVFVIGCGRSGTSLLGDILSSHDMTIYAYEPYYLWSALDNRLDILNLFNEIEPSLIFKKDDYLVAHKEEFQRYLKHLLRKHKQKTFIEKTPMNALRISWINQLVPNAKFIHVLRDGVNVCHSIAKLAHLNIYRMAGKPYLNQWWGNNNSKWHALKNNGTKAGYFCEEVNLLSNSDVAKASYEWLVTLMEVEKNAGALGDRLYTVTYPQLIYKTRETMIGILNYLGIEYTSDWLEKSVNFIKKPTISQRADSFSLPYSMSLKFNYYQEKHGFINSVNRGYNNG